VFKVPNIKNENKKQEVKNNISKIMSVIQAIQTITDKIKCKLSKINCKFTSTANKKGKINNPVNWEQILVQPIN
jgi:hypothetical protein